MSHSNSAQWHYAAGADQKGPFTRDQMAALVANGTVGPATLVWSASMAGWLAFAQSPLAAEIPLPGARPAGPAAPPRPPPYAGAPNPGPAPAGAYASPQAALHSAGQHAAAAGAALSAASGSGIVANMVAAVTTCLNKYVTFSGRAARPELWYFVLAAFIGNIACAIADTALAFIGLWFSPIGLLFALAMFLPSLAVGARRLHDTDRSAWWFLIVLVPGIGSIVLLVFYCLPGTPGRNRFG